MPQFVGFTRLALIFAVLALGWLLAGWLVVWSHRESLTKQTYTIALLVVELIALGLLCLSVVSLVIVP